MVQRKVVFACADAMPFDIGLLDAPD
jgi:hypothetical protein